VCCPDRLSSLKIFWFPFFHLRKVDWQQKNWPNSSSQTLSFSFQLLIQARSLFLLLEWMCCNGLPMLRKRCSLKYRPCSRIGSFAFASSKNEQPLASPHTPMSAHWPWCFPPVWRHWETVSAFWFPVSVPKFHLVVLSPSSLRFLVSVADSQCEVSTSSMF